MSEHKARGVTGRLTAVVIVLVTARTQWKALPKLNLVTDHF